MFLQPKPDFIMCPPDYLGIHNPYTQDGPAYASQIAAHEEFIASPERYRSKAWDQFLPLEETLKRTGRVFRARPKLGEFDQPFTADPSFSLTTPGRWNLRPLETTLISQFTNGERQGEVAISEEFIRQHFPWRTILRAPYAFEGSGDNLYDAFRDLIFSGYIENPTRETAAHGRSDIRAHAFMQNETGVEVVSLQVKLPCFHLDVSTAFLSKGHVLSYPGGLQPVANETLRRRAFDDFGLPQDRYLIEVSKEDADAYACNVQCIGDVVIMPKCSAKLQKQIRQAGYEVVSLELGQFIKAGGAVHCLSNNVNQHRVVGGLIQLAT